MTTATTLALHHQDCEHAPAYRKGCISCSVRYVKMLRSPDGKLSRRMQLRYLNGLPQIERETVLEILRRERAA